MKISFPAYFYKNPKFNSLFLNEEQFVNYTHNLNDIQNVQLSIEQTFLVFVLEGTAKFITNNGVYEVHQNEAAVITKGAYIMSETLSPDKDTFKAFLFFLSDDLIHDFSREMNISSKKCDNNTPIIRINTHPQLHNYIDSIMLLLIESNSNKDTPLTNIKAKELLHHIYNDETTFSQILCGLKNNENNEVKRIVEKNYLNKITIEQMAFLCGMSISTFKRKFEIIYNSPSATWIRCKKLEFAYALVINTSKSIVEISIEVGFNNTSHFIQAFKSQYKMSPTRLRE